MFDFITTLNGGVLAGMGLVAIVFLIATRSSEYGSIVAYRMSVRARLPFGSEAVAVSVRRRARALVRGNMWGLLIVVGIACIIFASTPLSSSPQFLWIVTVLIFLGVLTASALVVTLRERLFAPSPTAARVARVQIVGIRDYLGPWLRRTPDLLLVAALIVSAALALTQIVRGVDMLAATLSYASLALGIVLFVGTRIMERAVLAQPQPASSTLELAWDDLFRTDTLNTLRMSAAAGMWLSLGLSATLLVVSWLAAAHDMQSVAGLFPWWGVPAIQLVYLFAQGRLPSALYPDHLSVSPVDPKAAETGAHA